MYKVSANLVNQIKRHEGFSSKPYRDTVGKLTIGYGRNLDDVGIDIYESHVLLLNDLNKTLNKLYERFPLIDELDDLRKDVIINMAFNIGVDGFLKFHNMIDALSKKDYEKAADEMLNSLWAKQVKTRALELSKTMRNGK